MDTIPPGLRELAGVPDEVEAAAPDDRAAFGDFLRQARERRRLTLQQISQNTKISSRHLTALEEGNVKSLPRGMYRRAMLRAYAESVGLDKDAALEQFERTFQPPTATAQTAPPAMPAGPAETRNRDPRLLLAAVVVGATVVVGLVTGDTNQQPVAAQAQDAPVAEPREPQAAAPDIVAAQAPVTPQVDQVALAREPITHEVSATSGARDTTPVERQRAEELRPTTPQPAALATPPRPRVFDGELVVVSEPAGARVTVNGMGWGTTPVTVRHLPFGDKRVRVTKDGYLSQERVISLGASRPAATVRIDLSARQ